MRTANGRAYGGLYRADGRAFERFMSSSQLRSEADVESSAQSKPGFTLILRTCLATFQRVATSGLLFLLPVYIVLVVVTRAWASLATFGTNLASAFGLKSIMGVGASMVLSGFRSWSSGSSAGCLPRYRSSQHSADESKGGSQPTFPDMRSIDRWSRTSCRHMLERYPIQRCWSEAMRAGDQATPSRSTPMDYA